MQTMSKQQGLHLHRPLVNSTIKMCCDGPQWLHRALHDASSSTGVPRTGHGFAVCMAHCFC